MTVIAWDGRLLAADGLSTCDDHILTDDANKLHRLIHRDYGPMVAGIAGTVSWMTPWLKRIATEGFDSEKDIDAAGLFVDRRGRCWNANPEGGWNLATGFAAQGSGGLLAYTVLRDAGSAIDAVRFAARHSASCGGTIRVYCPASNVVVRLK